MKIMLPSSKCDSHVVARTCTERPNVALSVTRTLNHR